jgi:hypothetical protein
MLASRRTIQYSTKTRDSRASRCCEGFMQYASFRYLNAVIKVRAYHVCYSEPATAIRLRRCRLLEPCYAHILYLRLKLNWSRNRWLKLLRVELPHTGGVVLKPGPSFQALLSRPRLAGTTNNIYHLFEARFSYVYRPLSKQHSDAVPVAPLASAVSLERHLGVVQVLLWLRDTCPSATRVPSPLSVNTERGDGARHRG